MELIATKSLRYAGRSLVAGDRFEASDKDARLLKAIKKAEDYVALAVSSDDGDDKPTKGKYRTRRMKAVERDADEAETADVGVAQTESADEDGETTFEE